ncbi:MAG: hypothetical protein WEF86_13155 [Gemmatimonadota bacterium]
MCVALAAIFAGPLVGQDAAPGAAQLRVFIDCGFCDDNYLRTEITWVDYMRDRADADVHVLVSRQTTGGGGAAYTLEFIGLRDRAGHHDTLSWVASSDNTTDTIRRGLTRAMKHGLLPFVAGSPVARRLEVSLLPAADEDTTDAAGPGGDPWNYWTFSIGLNGFARGESQQQSQNFSSNIAANRTTEDWKVNLSLRGSYSESKFEYTIDDVSTTTTSISRSYSASSLIVKSVGPHFSVGARGSAGTSTFGNTSLSLQVSPAVEYNFIPYSESTRRSLTVRYSGGVSYADYREITLFGQEQETRPVHSLELDYGTRAPWGSVSLSVDGSQYLHDLQKYSAGVGGSTNIRLFRGLSLNFGGNFRRVKDQLSLAARDLTEEEILLRQRQLATSYSYFTNFGISYRFGSIFNNVVNPRFVGGGGGGGGG